MLKKLFILLTLLFCFKVSSAQITFSEIIGNNIVQEGASAVRQTNDDGYIILGESGAFGGSKSDFYLIKTDQAGDTIWAKSYGGLGDELSASVEQTSDSGYIITGRTYDLITNDMDVFLVKTNVYGDTLWTKTFGAAGNDWGNAVQQTVDGGFIVAGTSLSFNSGKEQIYLIKTDANGDSLWTKTYGGPGSDFAQDIKICNDGNFIIAGYTERFNGSPDAYLIKIDDDGNVLWSKTYGTEGFETATSIKQTSDYGFIFTGVISGFGSGASVYLVKTDADGDTLWTRAFSTTGQQTPTSVDQTNDGGYIISGYITDQPGVETDALLIRADAGGNFLWSRSFGSTINNQDYFNSVKQTSDGGFISAGTTYGFGFNYNIYFVKTDSSGNVGCYQNAPSIITDSTATVYLVAPTIVSSPASQLKQNSVNVFNSTAFSNVNILCASVGINEKDVEESFCIYPNPSSGKFSISFSSEEPERIVRIYNALGAEIYSDKIFKTLTADVDLTCNGKGFYILKISSKKTVLQESLLLNDIINF